MDALHTLNGKTVETPMAFAQKDIPHKDIPAKDIPTHRVECGDVGNAGLVGDLGSNAKE